MSRQSETNNALIVAREYLRNLLPLHATIYYTILSHSRTRVSTHVQFLAVHKGTIINITPQIARATLHTIDPLHANSMKILESAQGLIQNLGRTLYGDTSRGDFQIGAADYPWFKAVNTLA